MLRHRVNQCILFQIVTKEKRKAFFFFQDFIALQFLLRELKGNGQGDQNALSFFVLHQI